MALTLQELRENLATNKPNKTSANQMIQDLLRSNDASHIRIAKKTILEEYIKTLEEEKPVQMDTENVDSDSVQSEDYRVAKKYLQIANSAATRSKEFSLTLADVRKLLRVKKCHYTGVVFGDGDNAMTVDRIDSAKGYIKGNVVACTHWANQTKNSVYELPNGLAVGRTKEFKDLINKVSEYLAQEQI